MKKFFFIHTYRDLSIKTYTAQKKKKKKKNRGRNYVTPTHFSSEANLASRWHESKSHNIVLISRGLRIGRVHNNRGFGVIPKRLVDAANGWGQITRRRDAEGFVIVAWEVLANDNGTRVLLVEFGIF